MSGFDSGLRRVGSLAAAAQIVVESCRLDVMRGADRRRDADAGGARRSGGGRRARGVVGRAAYHGKHRGHEVQIGHFRADLLPVKLPRRPRRRKMAEFCGLRDAIPVTADHMISR